MKTTKLIATITTSTVALSAALAFLTSAPLASAATFNLTASEIGTWDSASVHRKGEYIIGYNVARPLAVAYFIVDLTPVRGRTVTAARMAIPGTTDFHISSHWIGHTPEIQFKVRIAPLDTGRFTLSNILNGMPNPADNWRIQHYESTVQNLSYNWIPEGLHPGFTFDAFHYDTFNLQNEVNAGGRWPMFATMGSDNMTDGQNYVWGSGAYSTAMKLVITVN